MIGFSLSPGTRIFKEHSNHSTAANNLTWERKARRPLADGTDREEKETQPLTFWWSLQGLPCQYSRGGKRQEGIACCRKCWAGENSWETRSLASPVEIGPSSPKKTEFVSEDFVRKLQLPQIQCMSRLHLSNIFSWKWFGCFKNRLNVDLINSVFKNVTSNHFPER